MSNEPEDVTVETTADADTDVTVENTVETEVEETVVDATPEADSEETETEEPVETVEERLERLEQEVAAKQKAIDRKTASQHSLQKAYERKLQELQAYQEQGKSEDLKEPKIDDFDDYTKYEKAKEEFFTKKVEREIKGKILQEQQQVAQQQLVQEKLAKRKEQEAEYIKINPRYSQSAKEVNDFIQTLDASQGVQDAVLEVVYDGNIPQIIDYFGANNGERLDELERITQMSPAKAAVEVYKIQQGLKTPVKKEMKPAPAPIKKVKGTARSKVDSIKMDEDNFRKQFLS